MESQLDKKHWSFRALEVMMASHFQQQRGASHVVYPFLD
jgi:hypothetical protein